MTTGRYLQLYGVEGEKEYSGIIIKNPMDKLRMELHLPTVPKRFTTTIWAEVEHCGQKLSLEDVDCRTQYDEMANRYVLEVDHPPQDHRFTIFWRLPELWS